MGRVRGFLEVPRKTATYRDPAERLADYNEFVERLTDEELRGQAGRCMDCGTPFCHASPGCPIANLIPEWNDLVYRGEWEYALHRLERTNNLPEVTGRICPAPCETACTLSINSSPVTIRQAELAIIERGFSRGWVIPRPPKRESGRTVAIVGSGPAGLAAAQQLRRAGHRVVMFEQNDRLGGILQYGIPNFKLEKWVIDRRVRQLEAEGVDFQLNVVIGEDISARYLRRSHDAVLLALGAGEPRDMAAPGRNLDGVHLALDYLSQANRFVAGSLRASEIITARNKTVLVIGGGDTGSDCVGTANRQGAKRVYQFEILPKPREWTQPWNPDWPHWPSVLRTSDSHEEGCERRWAVVTKKLSGASGAVRKAHCSEVKWETRGAESGPQFQEISGTTFTVDVDLVILAMGFLHVKHSKLLLDLNVEFNSRGNIEVDEQYATTVPGVFAAGDSHTGASLIVRAVNHGRRAAQAIDDYLT